MDFMISLFGSDNSDDQTSAEDRRRRCRLSSVTNKPTSPNSRLAPENEEGNVEYKLKLVCPTRDRLQHLITQLKWRLREGQGEAIYQIGVEDDGACVGLSEKEMSSSIATLKLMAESLNASVTILHQTEVPCHCRDKISGEDEKLSNPLPRTISHDMHRVCEALVRRVPDSQKFLELRIAVLGSADAGKSTLLGVLTQGEMDNGRGKARLNLFRHLHEVHSGRTSSISMDIIGFDHTGNLINYSKGSFEEIYEQSTKLITLIDLAGHEKYLKTTIYGLTAHAPQFALLVVAANQGLLETSINHISLAQALDIPVLVVVTKCDLVTDAVLERMAQNVEEYIRKSPQRRACGHLPFRVRTEDDTLLAQHNRSLVPLFFVSNVNGMGLDLLTRFLNILPLSESSQSQEKLIQELAEFQIDEIFNIPNVGVVVAGFLTKGIIREGDSALLGPNDNGHFTAVTIKSVHRNKRACTVVRAGEVASLAITSGEPDSGEISPESAARKGMVLVHSSTMPQASFIFEAEVFVLHHPSKMICIGFQTTVHIGHICQTATIVDMNRPCLKPGEVALVKFMFLQRPEYVTLRSRVLFREGKTTGMGHVTRISIKQEETHVHSEMIHSRTWPSLALLEKQSN